jgi:hypothetical protein
LFDPLRIAEWIVARNPHEETAAAKSLLNVIADQDEPSRFKAIRDKWAPLAE